MQSDLADLAVSVTQALTTTSILIGILAAVCTVSVIVYRTVRRIEEVIGVDKDGRTLTDRLEHVERQVFPNGGSSLSDHLRRTEHLTRENAAELRVVRDVVNQLLEFHQRHP